MTGALLFGLLAAGGVFLLFLALWHFLSAQEPVDERLKQYGVDDEVSLRAAEGQEEVTRLPGLNRTLGGLTLGQRLALKLSRTDVPMTVAEFSLVMLGIGFAGFILGFLRFGPIVGLIIGGIFAYLPLFYLSFQANLRRTKFGEQLPDVLSLLVGALRTGYGLLQGLEMLVTQMPAPSSIELARVVRAVSLGMPTQRALAELSARMQNDDLDLVVTAITVQYELGGNLAMTLETISETIRDRVRIKREIRSLTAQQRMTGYMLAGLPLVTGGMIYAINPAYMGRLFEPGLVRLIPTAAVVMIVLGFLIMNKIVAIEV